MEKISASIVVYKTEPEVLQQAITSYLQSTVTGKLTIIDNSPTRELESICPPEAEYIFPGKNLGYGKAHNIALRESLNHADYHLVLNPDVCFGPDVIERLFTFMEAQPQAGLAMPNVFSADQSEQRLCKLLPTPLNLAVRRFSPFESWFEKYNDRYEMKDCGTERVINVPFLSGCFMFLRTAALKKIGLFDERFFLYAEDTDLSRRIHQHYETLFYPGASITHIHARGSYKSLDLTLQNLKSAFQYFNKWGWFFDDERMKLNQRAMLQRHKINVTEKTIAEVAAA
ncbi:MAG: glycosyltransferase family 2 protein [Bacteroidetes bacterium]|nr:glycosyltransferase family 2 protein [Bacteroidota bacterium]